MTLFGKKNKPILVCGDFHAPYHHKHTIEFLQDMHAQFKCDPTIIHDGDLFDFHAMSRHIHECDAAAPDEEYAKALAFSANFSKAFPKGVLVLGNHDLIPQRQMQTLSLSEKLLKELNALYGLSRGWEIHKLYYVIKKWDILVEHGINSGGVNGALNSAIYKRCSFVQGHMHAEAGVKYSANHNSLIFGLNTGCLCDNTALAQRYAKYVKKKGILGCGIIYNNSNAIFVPMERS